MKIEFCCEEMAQEWEEDNFSHHEHEFQYWSGNLWVATGDTCPYCDAKIEITVKGK